MKKESTVAKAKKYTLEDFTMESVMKEATGNWRMIFLVVKSVGISTIQTFLHF